jgi:hypothetical protein
LGATEDLGCTFFAQGRLADDLGRAGHGDSVKNRTKVGVRVKYRLLQVGLDSGSVLPAAS